MLYAFTGAGCLTVSVQGSARQWLAEFGAAAVALARSLIEEYADLGIGLADASIAVLARTLEVNDLLSLDERHFRTLPGAEGRPFRLLPADL